MNEKPSRWDSNDPREKLDQESLDAIDTVEKRGKNFFSKVKDYVEKLDEENKALHHYHDISFDDAYSVILRAGAKLGFTVITADKQSGSVNFQTGSGERRWDGTMSCIVILEGNGVEILTSSRTEKGGIYNPMGISASAAEGARGIKEAQLLLKIKAEMIEYRKKSGTYVEDKMCRYCKEKYLSEDCPQCFPSLESKSSGPQDVHQEVLTNRLRSDETSKVNLEFKICPMCAEEIKYAAKKCRYCQHLLEE
jgi:hypothetical protein